MFVYMTICNINNKKYIGKYEGSESHPYLGSGKLLRRAIEKYGKENFTRIILERCKTSDEVRFAEKKHIAAFDAVKSDEFYNIAIGGEGGNTYAGLSDSKYNDVMKKLKLRKRPDNSWNKDNTVVINLLTGCNEQIPIDEFKNGLYVGIACKGIYITPFGCFTSIKTMSETLKMDGYSLMNKCKNNLRIVRVAHLQSLDTTSKYYTYLNNHIGMTFKDIGFDFISIKNFINKPRSFYTQFEIIK